MSDGPADVVRVVLADDQVMLRRSLATIIDRMDGLSVVGEAADGLAALELASSARPDVLVMDIRMPVMDGIEATRRICADPQLSAVRILVLSMFELDEYVYRALRAGASGFVLKDARPDDLVAAIRRTHAGELSFAPSILGRLVEHFLISARTVPAGRALDLTDRETEVLTLVGRGLSNAEISERLYISMKTVKTHISHLLAKVPARDRAQLVIAAYSSGLVTTDG
jgi:DNA-binding NarL/FixJ family response regulator